MRCVQITSQSQSHMTTAYFKLDKTKLKLCLDMSFLGTSVYSLAGVAQCWCATVRPSDQSIILACYNLDHNNYLYIVNTNGTVTLQFESSSHRFVGDEED